MNKPSGNIITIELPLPLKMGCVNCYLVQNEDHFLLIDTGSSSARAELGKALKSAGCEPPNLKLIILTHGDFDHSGNAAYLRQTYGAPVAMHPDDRGMVEQGNMFINRKQPNWLIRVLIPYFTGFGKNERFSPDLISGERYDLSGYGFNARVVSIPGHSKGSIGILFADGSLFCGDLFENLKGPSLNAIMDDPQAAKTSTDLLRHLPVKIIYPGHGKAFLMANLAG